ncbi:protein FAR-RED IMPAIRED RESPONSE 1-like [Panicum virgatum]|uniref:protein FAR-RED IMPAIRED RESPONSE 1-like n=1 Tax=Panicum virgatum TaxID=38727 RepID=UPI0019D4F629|nr:protein FAR-RED IMPAIRED RESPONSE 1-like [Panicum virgatum]
MDLNEFPPELDYDFLDESIANPSYYTQAPLCDASLRGSEHNNAGNDLYNQNDSDNQNADACSLNNPEDAATPDQLVLGVTEEVEEDIWLTPPVPYGGQTFSKKKKKLDGGTKRKREKMLHTDCKDRMVVKLIADKWHDGQDFRTDDRERRRWSKYPIEIHASAVYTKNLFYRFSKEFEKTAEYDVRPEGQFLYLLEPNNKFVYGYGKRTYIVTAVVEEESYYCECSKFDGDGMFCCHIMKILTRLDVKTIPQRYILKRWTKEAIPENENVDPNAHVPADFIASGMPLNNKKTLWFTNLSTAFTGLVVEGCASKETYTIMDGHIKMMRAEIDEIKQRKKNNAQKVRGSKCAPSVCVYGDDNTANMTIIASADAQSVPGPIVHNVLSEHDTNVNENTASTGVDDAALVGITNDVDGASALMADVGNPPRSKVKGRKKDKRFKKG